MYIHDILIYLKTSKEHVVHVQSVLSRLLQNNLLAKAEKCEFHKHTITFLGYVISEQGVQMDNSKVSAVTEWPKPTSVKQLQRFLGFTNFYRRFIQNYSIVATPSQPYFVENQKRFPCLEQHNRPLTNCRNNSCTQEADPEPILLASMITAPVRWHLVEEIIQAQCYEMPPPACPPMLQYVPNALRQCTMEWVLTTPSSSHLGFQRTIRLLQNTFWWPSLAADTKRYVETCSVCAQVCTPASFQWVYTWVHMGLQQLS